MTTMFGNSDVSNEILDTQKTGNCFSRANFIRVYKYIEDQIKKSSATFYTYDNYELFLKDTSEISFKKDGWTLSIITIEKGAFSLAIRKRDNDKIKRKTNHIFCEILLLIEN